MQDAIIDGRWALLHSIGKGGMGEVFLARHTTLETTVALKLLKPELSQDTLSREKMITEAKAAAKIKHANVVLVTDVGQTKDGVIFIVMEHVDGRDLKTLLDEEGPLAMDRARLLLVQIASGLAAAHANKVIHRDVKPANCVVARSSDGTEVVKILDFGIAKILEDKNDTAKESPTTNRWFTRHYVAPEVEKGHASDERSDVYSFGVLAYRMLTGHYPYEKTFKAITPPDHYRPDIPCDLCELIRDALRPDPDDRPVSMARVCQRLAGGLVEHPSESFGPSDSLGGSTSPIHLSAETAPDGRDPPRRDPRPHVRWGRWVLGPSLLGSTLLLTTFLDPLNPLELGAAVSLPIPVPDTARQQPEDPPDEKKIPAGVENDPPPPPSSREPVATGPVGSGSSRSTPQEQPARRGPAPDPDKRAKDMVKGCLSKTTRDGCLGERPRREIPVFFTFKVEGGKSWGLEATTPDGKVNECIARAMETCNPRKLSDRYYEFDVKL